MPVRIRDVALRAGVSNATVSRVLANKPYTSQAVRARVLAAVKELGYQPSHVARSLRVQHSQIIGLIISDIQNPFFTSLGRAVEDVAYDHQYAVFLCNSDEDMEKEALYVDLMYAEKVSGVVLTPTRARDNPCRKLIEARFPVVAVDRRVVDMDVDTVVIDNVGAAFDLVSHLISDGHRRIAAVVGPLTTTTDRERLEGYSRALRVHSLPVFHQLVQAGGSKVELGYQMTHALLSLPEPPTALFTGNYLLTLGTLRAIRERGLRIPRDIALAAFDEMEWTSLVEPSLTVVAQPTYELGRTAANLLLERIEDNRRPVQQVVLKPTIYFRQSCGHRQEVTHAGTCVGETDLRC
jgi:DNA-binding LacI/PurR family transcriptional regulator